MPSSDFPLAQILRAKLIPWAQSDLENRVLIGTRQMPGEPMVPGVKIVPCTLNGPRIVNRGERQRDGKRWVIARWPQDALSEIIQPRFICVVSGRMKYQINDYYMECNAGHILIIPPGVPHSDGTRTCAADKNSYCELLYITSFPNSIHCWLDRFQEDSDGIEPIGNILLLNEHLSTTHRLLMEEIMEQGSAASNVVSGLMEVFWIQMQRMVAANDFLPINRSDKNYLHHAGSMSVAGSQDDSFLSILRNYIDTHIHETITINDMTKIMYLSRPQFTRRIRRETGLSFVEYLTHRRIEHAGKLLRETPWGIKSIADAVGIEPSYFSTVFFRQTGMTPSQFRRQEKIDSIIE